MHFFESDYNYKIKLLGYTIQEKKSEYIKVNMYLKTHGEIYTISYVLTTLGETFLSHNKGYDDVELILADCYGICDKNLILTKVCVNEKDLQEKNITNAKLLLRLLKEDSEVITTDYFAINLEGKELILYFENFKQVKLKQLKEKLEEV